MSGRSKDRKRMNLHLMNYHVIMIFIQAIELVISLPEKKCIYFPIKRRNIKNLNCKINFLYLMNSEEKRRIEMESSGSIDFFVHSFRFLSTLKKSQSAVISKINERFEHLTPQKFIEWMIEHAIKFYYFSISFKFNEFHSCLKWALSINLRGINRYY